MTKTKVTPISVLEGLQLDLEILAQARVEGAQRLVEQEHPRPQDERAGERDALLLAAGELVGIRFSNPVSCTRSSISADRCATLLPSSSSGT